MARPSVVGSPHRDTQLLTPSEDPPDVRVFFIGNTDPLAGKSGCDPDRRRRAQVKKEQQSQETVALGNRPHELKLQRLAIVVEAA